MSGYEYAILFGEDGYSNKNFGVFNKIIMGIAIINTTMPQVNQIKKNSEVVAQA